MANEIVNRQGAANGQTKHGAVFVKTGGRGLGDPESTNNFGQSMERGIQPAQNIAVITDDLNDRFDDPRYYAGDTSA